MKKYLLATAAVAALASPAFAGDLSAPPAYSPGGITAAPPPAAPPAVVAAAPVRQTDWNGSYLSLILGYGTGGSQGDASSFTLLRQSVKPDTDGVLGGIGAGYNYQYGQIVFGVVGDFTGANITGTKSDSATLSAAGANNFFGVGGFTGPTAVSTSVEVTNIWNGTLRGRVGYAWYDSPLMFYGTGGFAFGDVRMRLNATGTDGNVATQVGYTQDRTLLGYAVGVGTEMMLDRNFSAGAEYLFTDLQKQSFFGDVLTRSIDAGQRNHNFRASVSYHF